MYISSSAVLTQTVSMVLNGISGLPCLHSLPPRAEEISILVRLYCIDRSVYELRGIFCLQHS